MQRLTKFFAGVWLEVKRVQWPKGKDLTKLSIATISFMVFNAVFFYGVGVLMILLKDVIKSL